MHMFSSRCFCEGFDRLALFFHSNTEALLLMDAL